MLPLPDAFIDGRVGVLPHSTSQGPCGTALTLPSLGSPGPHLSSLLALAPHSPSPRLEPAQPPRWIQEPCWERMDPWHWDCWAEGILLSQDTSHLIPWDSSGLAALGLALHRRAGHPLVPVVGEGGHQLWLTGCGAQRGVSRAQSLPNPALPQDGEYLRKGFSLK